VNGELVGNAPVADILSTDGALRIGGGDLWWSDEGFKGRIDEVRVYDRALSTGEIGGDSAAPIQTPHKAQSPPTPSTPAKGKSPKTSPATATTGRSKALNGPIAANTATPSSSMAKKENASPSPTPKTSAPPKK
jgi:hypothetical protein